MNLTKGKILKYFLFSVTLALFISACGENNNPSEPNVTPASSTSSTSSAPSAPSVPMIDGAPMVETLQPVLHGSCDGDATISLYVDDRLVSPAATCSGGSYTIQPDAQLTHGRHCFSVQATDAAGAASDRSEATCAFTGRPFITVWKTDNQGITENNQIRITPDTYRYAYNYSVDWGDGTSEMNLTTGDVVHTYPSAGVYTVKINGVFPLFYVRDDDEDYGVEESSYVKSDKLKLIGVSQWGSIPWLSMSGSFDMCANTDFNATDIPDLSNATSLRSAFFGVATSVPENIGEWNTASVITMESTFMTVTTDSILLDIDISAWDISSLKDAINMFDGTTLPTASYDKLLNSWSKQPVKHDVYFSAGNSHYSPAAAAARSVLTDQYGWTIHDGGLVK